jgi:hypothetical protein
MTIPPPTSTDATSTSVTTLGRFTTAGTTSTGMAGLIMTTTSTGMVIRTGWSIVRSCARAGVNAVGLSLAILGVAAGAQALILATSGSVALLADLIHNTELFLPPH